MDDDINSNDVTERPTDVSRCAFIKGVIGSGAAAVSAGYLLRSSPVVQGSLAPARMSDRLITLNADRQPEKER
jgi:hypothetical protein